jgi:hypothetical protein
LPLLDFQPNRQQARVLISYGCFPEIAKRSIVTVFTAKAVQERRRRESTKYLIDLWQLQLVLLGVVGDDRSPRQWRKGKSDTSRKALEGHSPGAPSHFANLEALFAPSIVFWMPVNLLFAACCSPKECRIAAQPGSRISAKPGSRIAAGLYAPVRAAAHWLGGCVIRHVMRWLTCRKHYGLRAAIDLGGRGELAHKQERSGHLHAFLLVRTAKLNNSVVRHILIHAIEIWTFEFRVGRPHKQRFANTDRSPIVGGNRSALLVTWASAL